MLEQEQLNNIAGNWKVLKECVTDEWRRVTEALQTDEDGYLLVTEPTITACCLNDGSISVIRVMPGRHTESGTNVYTRPESNNIELAHYYPGLDGYFDVTGLFPAEMQTFLSAPKSRKEILVYLSGLMQKHEVPAANASDQPELLDQHAVITEIGSQYKGKETEPRRDPVMLTPSQVEHLQSVGHTETVEEGLKEARFLLSVKTRWGYFNVFICEKIGMVKLYYLIPWGGIVEKTVLAVGNNQDFEDIAKMQVASYEEAIAQYARTGALYL